MDNQLHTQKKLSEEKTPGQTYHEAKDKIIRTVKDNLNYIYILLMIIANCLISLLKIEDGHIGLRYPHDTIGWVMWFVQIGLGVLVGVLILNAFRRQGIHNGHKSIKDTHKAYIDAITSPTKETPKPRSLKQYMRIQATRDSLVKALIYVIISVFTGSVIVSANLNNLLSLVVNIIFAVGFGLKAMLDAEEFVITELVVWYKIKTKEALDSLNKEEQESGRVKTGYEELSIGSTEPSGIQSQEEHTTGPSTDNDQQPTATTD